MIRYVEHGIQTVYIMPTSGSAMDRLFGVQRVAQHDGTLLMKGARHSRSDGQNQVSLQKVEDHAKNNIRVLIPTVGSKIMYSNMM